MSTSSIPQGVAAILGFDYEADFDSNTRLMTEALKSVQTIEITRAVRATKFNGFDIKKKQAIGVLNDGDIVSVDDEPEAAMLKALAKLKPEKHEVLTIYYGTDAEEQAQQAKEQVPAKYPHLPLEVVKGGRPSTTTSSRWNKAGRRTWPSGL